MGTRSPLLAALDRPPLDPAFDFDGSALTFGALDRSSCRIAAGLARLGVRPGDRVAWFGPSSPELIELLVAVLRMGAIHVPINTRYQAEETAHVLDDSGARLAVVAEGSVGHACARERAGAVTTVVLGQPGPGELSFEALRNGDEAADAPAPAADAVAMLVYTSGTTGRSKGVALTHGGLAANLDAILGLWRLGPDDRLALCLPLFHVHGLGLGVLGTLMRGGTALVAQRFDPAWVVDAFASRGATVFMGVPTMYARLLEHLDATPADARALSKGRLFTSGSAALPASHHQAFARHTGHAVLERYGMTETGFTLSNPYEGERRAGTVGFPVPGVEVRLVDDADAPCPPGETGEIQVRGPGLLAGYWGLDEATRAAFTGDGWFRTGDVAFVDADGYHHIVGRRSVDIIKSGGFKISAREIEDALLEHPALAEAAVIGLPDPVWGERIVAAVVARAGQDVRALPAALGEHCARQLADFKKPRRFLVVESLPRNALGKLQKHRVAELFAGLAPE
ncbi:MAG: AMP-binding protein [Deltaproteobacteria bacterium]|nr:AMP-binding protein [Deltaproteobacteria bacterium]